MKEQFRIDDIVEAFGNRGTVTKTKGQDTQYPVCVLFDTSYEGFFTKDGKYLEWHKLPSLKPIERPKKKIKRTYWYLSHKVEGAEFRRTSNLYSDKVVLSTMAVGAPDRQTHSVEIEEWE